MWKIDQLYKTPVLGLKFKILSENNHNENLKKMRKNDTNNLCFVTGIIV